MAEFNIEINPKRQIKLTHFYDYAITKSENLYKFYSAPKDIRKDYISRVIAENPNAKLLVKRLDRRLKCAKALNAIATIATMPFAVTATLVGMVEVAVGTLPILGLTGGIALLNIAESVPQKIAGGALTGICGALTFVTVVPLDLAVGIINSPNKLRQLATKKAVEKKVLKESEIMGQIRKMAPESCKFLDNIGGRPKAIIYDEENNINI